MKKINSKAKPKAKKTVVKSIKTIVKKSVKKAKPVRKKLGKGLEDISTLFLSSVKKRAKAVVKKTVIKKAAKPKVKTVKTSVTKKAAKVTKAKKTTPVKKSTKAKKVAKPTAIKKKKVAVKKAQKVVAKKIEKKVVVKKKSAAKKTVKKTTASAVKKIAKKITKKVSKKAAVKKTVIKKTTSKPSKKKTEVVGMAMSKKSSDDNKTSTNDQLTGKKTAKAKLVLKKQDGKQSKNGQTLGPISELKTLVKKGRLKDSKASLKNIQTKQMIEDSKFFVSKEPVNRIAEDKFYELPAGYGDNRIVIQVRDPYWVFAYWEVSQRKINSVTQKYGNAINNARRVLRVYDITGITFNGSNANNFFDIDINDGAKNWYVNVGNPGRSYCVEIGLVLADGSFVLLARSNFITTPSDGPSEVTDEEWMVVEDDFNKLYGLSAGLGVGLSSMDLRKQMTTRLKNLSSGALSSPGVTAVTPKRDFWLVVNTELIVYGATQPGSELTVQGQPIKLSEDGTFSLRFALPDGVQDIPVRAVSSDKVEERVINPIVKKKTV